MRWILFTLLWPLCSFSTGLVCQENPRSVRVEIEVQPTQLQMRVWSPLGYNYLPQFEGPVSASQIPWMQYQTEQLAALGDYFTVTWPRENCYYQIGPTKDKTHVQCQGSSVSSAPEIMFHTLNLAYINESSFAGNFSTRRFRVMVSKSGEFGADFFYVSIAVANSFCYDILNYE